jgi:hypothetical protein
MAISVANKLGTGISPKAFIEGMTKNKDAFIENYNSFSWVTEDDKQFFESLNYRDDLKVLILTADWCGDALRSIPVVFRALEVANLDTEVFIVEQHQDLMDDFLTLGGRSVPVVIIADSGGHVLGRWGPRPAHVQQLMIEFKQANPDRDAADYNHKMTELRKQMVAKYEEKGGVHSSVVSELRELLSGF